MKRMCAVLLLSLMAWSGFSTAAQSPQALVEQTSGLMLAKLKEEQQVIEAEPGRLYELVNEIVLPHFDFEYMSQLVLAKYWRRASAEQRAAFVVEFRTLLVRTYATSLKQYVDQEIVFLPSRAQRDDEATVKTEVEQPGGFPIPIDYHLHTKNDAWKVFDVVIDDVSLVTNYRSSFAKEIRQGGIDSLVETLAERNRKGIE